MLTSLTTTSNPDETKDINHLIDEVVPMSSVWKNTPNVSLGGKTPAECIGTTSERFLRDILRAAKHGMFS